MWNVLIVDDEPELMDLCEMLVRDKLGGQCNFIREYDGLDAFLQGSTIHLDLVITDLKMPKVTGEELLVELLQNPKHAQVPIIVLSGQIEDSVRRKFSSHENIRFLEKPFRPSALEDLIEALVPQKG